MRERGRALACVGAVIGAGFASGREVMVFFARYGAASWALIVLAAGAMAALCALAMRAARRARAGSWCALYPGKAEGTLAKVCRLGLFGATGARMLPAAGELGALLVPLRAAYPLGLAATALLAWALCRGGLKPLAGLSLILAVALLGCCCAVLSSAGQPSARAEPPPGGARAVIGVIAYAGLNVAIGLGVVCECADGPPRQLCRTAALFGLMMTGLLFVSNALYLRHPELEAAPLPMVRLLGALGRAGYGIGAATLYLAVFTTLLAILRALRALTEPLPLPAAVRSALPMAPPLLFSLVGFERIVEGWYAPVGLCCLAALFAPLIRRRNVRTNQDASAP